MGNFGKRQGIGPVQRTSVSWCNQPTNPPNRLLCEFSGPYHSAMLRAARHFVRDSDHRFASRSVPAPNSSRVRWMALTSGVASNVALSPIPTAQPFSPSGRFAAFSGTQRYGDFTGAQHIQGRLDGTSPSAGARLRARPWVLLADATPRKVHELKPRCTQTTRALSTAARSAWTSNGLVR